MYAEQKPDDAGGILSFKSKEELKKLGLPDLDFETKRVFTVIITVADPSGDKKTSVTVTVDLTDYNEMPKWVKDTSPTRVVYPENGTDALAKYIAKDPETTVNYGLVKVADTGRVRPAITADDVDAPIRSPCSRSTLLPASSASRNRPITKSRRTESY